MKQIYSTQNTAKKKCHLLKTNPYNDIYNPTWVEINLDAIAHNVDQVKHAHPKKTIFAVVKANGYGHGDLEVAEVALENGASVLAVSSLEEALNLRFKGLNCPIFVMGATEIRHVPLAAKHRITLTAYDENWIKELITLELQTSLNVHMKIDTGMHRLGLMSIQEIITCIHLIKRHPMIELEGIYTHMATADDNQEYFKQQVATFKTILTSFDTSQIKYIHLANTATLLQHHFNFEHAIRVGIGMYGIDPTHEASEKEFKLKPALSFYSRLTQVKELKKGTKVGYGITYECKTDEWIGVIPVGYADGWIRKHQGRKVLINNHECEIIGRICMDQMMVRLPAKFDIGTKVTLIGKNMPVQRVAAEMETIPYETLCAISDRVPRIYYKNGNLLHCRKMRFT